MKIQIDKEDFWRSVFFSIVFWVGAFFIEAYNFLSILFFETTMFFWNMLDYVFYMPSGWSSLPSALVLMCITFIIYFLFTLILFYLSTRLFKGKKFLIRFSVPLTLIAIELVAVIYTAMLYYHGAL